MVCKAKAEISQQLLDADSCPALSDFYNSFLWVPLIKRII
jgi:hypothetical protein